MANETDTGTNTNRVTVLRRWGRLLGRTIAALAGGIIVYLLFTVKPGGGSDTEALLQLQEYKLWLGLLAGLTVLGIAISPKLWSLYSKLVALDRSIGGTAAEDVMSRTELWVAYAVVAVAIVVAQSFSAWIEPIEGWPFRSAAYFAIGLIITAPATVGLWLAALILTQLRQVIRAIPAVPNQPLRWDHPRAQTVEQLAALRILISRFLATLSTVVSAITLAAGAGRVAVLASPNPPSFPAAAPLLLGLFFSVVLAVSYLPAAVNLQDACGEFTNRVSPIPTDNLADTWSAERERVEKLLPTGETKDAAQTSLAIFAPLLASLSTVIFK